MGVFLFTLAFAGFTRFDLTPEELAALQESAASVKKGLENLPE